MPESKPRILFLIDGFGALLSAFLLGIVLVKLESVFGIPKKSLYFLATLPILFAVYDFTCYFNNQINVGKCLKTIGIINLMYCSLSLLIALYHYDVITLFGWTYIIVEIIIVYNLAKLEIKTGVKLMD